MCLTAAPRDSIRKGMLGHYTLLGSSRQLDPQRVNESFRFSFVILSLQCLIEACAEGHDVYEKGGIPHAVSLLDDDVLLKEKRKGKKKITILQRR